jgi:hypothetical protein
LLLWVHWYAVLAFTTIVRPTAQDAEAGVVKLLHTSMLLVAGVVTVVVAHAVKPGVPLAVGVDGIPR